MPIKRGVETRDNDLVLRRRRARAAPMRRAVSLASSSRGRRAVVDVRARADDDGPSTGRRRRVDRVKRRGCRSETICSYDLSLGCGGSRERERDETTSD